MTLGYAQSLSGALHDYRRVLLLLTLSLLALVPVYIKARRKAKDVGLHKRDSLDNDGNESRSLQPSSFRKDSCKSSSHSAHQSKLPNKGKRDPAGDV